MRLLKKFTIFVIILVLIISLLNVIKIQTIVLEKMYPIEYAQYVEKYAKEFGIDEKYIYSIIKAESNYDLKANSSKGAMGLMQLLPTTAAEIAIGLGIEFEEKDLYNPEINIMIGTKYFSNLLKVYENTMIALAAYNAGPGNVSRWIENGSIKEDGTDIENIPYKETNMYVRKIVQNYRIYEKLYS